MTVRLASATASALADRITALVDGGAGAGTLKVYTGALPADLVPTTLLATFTLTDPAAAAAVAGAAAWDFDPDLSATVAADGTAGWFLVEDSTGVDVFGGDCGDDASSAALKFTGGTAWTTGGTVNLLAGTVTQPQV